MTRLQDVPIEQRPQSTSAWRFLVETEAEGLWDLTAHSDGSYSARFHDDGEVIPLMDMAYNSDLGLFRRGEFPDERDEP